LFHGKRRGRVDGAWLRAQREHLGTGRVVSGGVQVAQRVHALQDVLLAHGGTFAVGHRVVRGGRLGQAGQHCGLGHRQLVERLVEIHRRCRRKAVGALAQVDLVHVQLQDLVLAVRGLQLVGEQDLHELAAVGFGTA
jgi:hypothetical protein